MKDRRASCRYIQQRRVVLRGNLMRERLVARGTVLVVDDETFIVDILTEALESAGYQVYTAAGDATLRTAREVRPDLILLDILMPAMDGGDVSRRLRADPRTAGIPIIALTALLDIHTRMAEMPVDDYLVKPFDLAELLDHVRRWTGRASHADRLLT